MNTKRYRAEGESSESDVEEDLNEDEDEAEDNPSSILGQDNQFKNMPLLPSE